jgi:GNAT superfamily N-acetyltransferase
MSEAVDVLVDGEVALRYFPYTQQRPTAERATVVGGLDRAVAAALKQLKGWWFSSDDDSFIDALLANGATIARHVVLMSRNITSDDRCTDAGPDGYQIQPIAAPPEQLAALAALAYPLDHVDHASSEEEGEKGFVDLLNGTLVGQYMAGPSGQILDGGELVATCIVNRGADNPPYGGPWVSEIFRHPDPRFAGLGRALMTHAIGELAAAGEETLSLVVTAENPAQRLYETLGFEVKGARRKLLIPGRP